MPQTSGKLPAQIGYKSVQPGGGENSEGLLSPSPDQPSPAKSSRVSSHSQVFLELPFNAAAQQQH
eukprot:2248933-Rhodomonas_salina.4